MQGRGETDPSDLRRAFTGSGGPGRGRGGRRGAIGREIWRRIIAGSVMVVFLVAVIDFIGREDESVVAWLDGIPERVGESTGFALRGVTSGQMRAYLPPAPQGWERLDWTPEQEAALYAGRVPSAPFSTVPFPHDGDIADTIYVSGFRLAGLWQARQAARQSYVYRQGDAEIILRLRHVPQGSDRSPFILYELGANDFGAFERKRLRFVHHEIGFRDINRASRLGGVERYKGYLGDQIEISVSAKGANRVMVGRLIYAIEVAPLRAMIAPPRVPQPDHAELMAELRATKR